MLDYLYHCVAHLVRVVWVCLGAEGGAMAEELAEVEEELEEAAHGESVGMLEGGNKTVKANDLLSTLSKYVSPVFVQGFTMTFLAEWGDRSQVATIALAAAAGADPVLTYTSHTFTAYFYIHHDNHPHIHLFVCVAVAWMLPLLNVVMYVYVCV